MPPKKLSDVEQYNTKKVLPRKVSIELGGPQKFDVKFEGPWTGKDIMLVRHNLGREYYRRQRALRQTLEEVTT